MRGRGEDSGKKNEQKAKKIHQRLKGMSLNRESQAGLYTERERGTKGERESKGEEGRIRLQGRQKKNTIE